MELFDCVCPMDYRYYGGDKDFFNRLRPYLSEGANVRYLLMVELALVETLAEFRVCPGSVVDEVRLACGEITAEEVYAEEARIHHNIRALVNCIRRRVSKKARPYIHLFATSCDIMDTGAALRYKELATDVMIPDLFELEKVLIKMAREYADVTQIGRTHGRHAEPITFGFAMALYVSRLGGRIAAIRRACDDLRGKFSGSVGAYNALSLFYPEDPAVFEIAFLQRLGLRPSDSSISSQIVEPEYVADFVYSVVSAFSVLANLADDMRHLRRSEINELKEEPEKERVGSSTMPHKVNPYNFENVKSLWKQFAPRIVTVLMDQISEHQRDLTNSASGRFVGELLAGFIYAANRLRTALQGVSLDREHIGRNLESSKDEFISEPLYVLLSLKGYPNGYERIKSLSGQARSNGRSLWELVQEDPELRPYLDRIEEGNRRILSNPTRYTGAAYQRTLATCEYWEIALGIP